jgi:hypothetical protein
MDKGKHTGIEFISEDHVPQSLEAALRGFLSKYPGTWRVRINLQLTGGWSSVTVSTEGFHRVLLASPTERTPDAVMHQLREALNPGATPAEPWDGRERRAHTRT